jgi:hypothetical protein
MVLRMTIIIIIIINCKWFYTRWQCTTMQDRKLQHNTMQYNNTQQKIKYNSEGHPQKQNYKKKKKKIGTQIIRYWDWETKAEKGEFRGGWSKCA